jgi:hypothetical protein
VEWQRGLVRERLGIEPDEMPGGHCVALSRPAELVELLESLRLLPGEGPGPMRGSAAHGGRRA